MHKSMAMWHVIVYADADVTRSNKQKFIARPL